jgi:KH domain
VLAQQSRLTLQRALLRFTCLAVDTGTQYTPLMPSTAAATLCCINSLQVGLVIGKAGATIKGIQARTQANIQVPPQPDADNPAMRTISISASSMSQVGSLTACVYVN